MTDSSSLFQRIKTVRARTAVEIPMLCDIALECIDIIKNEKSKQISTVEHKGRRYSLIHITNRTESLVSRPVREDLFSWDVEYIESLCTNTCSGKWNPSKSEDLERLIYIIQQATAVYLDLYKRNAARRVVGTFFEAVIACSLNRASDLEIGSGTIQIPGSSQSILTDLGLYRESSPIVLAATKTSTRERLSQPFVQKHILDQTLDIPPKSILIVIGDVQRSGPSNVQHTFTAGQFLLYWKYIAPLDGVYYIDIPPQAQSSEFSDKLSRLSQLFRSDLLSMI